MSILSKEIIEHLRKTEGHLYNPGTLETVIALLDVTGKDPFSDFFGKDLFQYAETILLRYKGDRKAFGKKLFKLYLKVLPPKKMRPKGKAIPIHYIIWGSFIEAVEDLVEGRAGFKETQIKTFRFVQTVFQLEQQGYKTPNTFAFTRFMILLVVSQYAPKKEYVPPEKELIIFAKFIVSGCSVIITDKVEKLTILQLDQMPMTEKGKVMYDGVEQMKKYLQAEDLELSPEILVDDRNNKDPGSTRN